MSTIITKCSECGGRVTFISLADKTQKEYDKHPDKKLCDKCLRPLLEAIPMPKCA